MFNGEVPEMFLPAGVKLITVQQDKISLLFGFEHSLLRTNEI